MGIFTDLKSAATFITSGLFVHVLVLLSGCAALSWEVIWQLKSGLALGVSAWGAAVTLALTMGGMAAGAMITGRALKSRSSVRPLRLYGALECTIGACGLLLGPAFALIADIDTLSYAMDPGNGWLVYTLGLGAVLGIPALCLGATLPVIGLAAQQHKTSIALLYGLNTLGAAAGALLAAFALIPALGITHATWLIAAINITVGLTAIAFGRESIELQREEKHAASPSATGLRAAILIATATGFATFALEVAWFRSLTSAFKSTTFAFALMLSCVLIALGLGARMVPLVKKRAFPLGLLLAIAGILILLTTPLVERFDLVAFGAPSILLLLVRRFFMTLIVIGPPIFFLGIVLPWLLDEQRTPQRWGLIYGINALAAIAGSLCAAWLLLPAIGFAKTAWLAGLLLIVAGLVAGVGQKRAVLTGMTVVALLLAVIFESGVGKDRVQTGRLIEGLLTAKILKSFEGPDATISVVETDAGNRMLVINGFIATIQFGKPINRLEPSHYMAWMGHLPMLLHPAPKKALVICFGTGQTANAVRRERPESLHIVDLNRHVFDMAGYFSKNENVLQDPIVDTTVMDGRAFIRRTQEKFDVITLEPMPPNFAGVNALYSEEFYRLARERLNPGGIIAQWLPFHLVPPYYSASIARTMQTVFPNTILWIDSLSGTGILLGAKDTAEPLGQTLYGYDRDGIARDLTEAQVRAGIALTPGQLEKYAQAGEVVTDDNQLLSYGKAVYLLHDLEKMQEQNRSFIEETTGTRLKEILQ